MAGFVDFLNKASGSPFNATATLKSMFVAAGFSELREDATWCPLPQGGKFLFTRGMTSLVAFCIGNKYAPGNGFAAVGAHTDSPALKLKPASAGESAKCCTVACETYGGGIWQTWFDRDLGVAGIVIGRRRGEEKTFTQVVSLKRPILRIPTMAIHLDSSYNGDGFKVNKENDLRMLMASLTAESAPGASPIQPLLLKAVAKEVGCAPEEIEGFDLRVCDSQPACLSGIMEEFVSGQGIDDLNGCYCTARGLIESSANLSEETGIRIAFFFDHEEVGSSSPQGADSSFISTTLSRILRNTITVPGVNEQENLDVAIRKSLFLSVDNAHAAHPNNPGKLESRHSPAMNGGPVVKVNSSLRYATEAAGLHFITGVATRHEIPLQRFVPRQDMPCGTTIGPIVSSKVGMRAIDIGNPQLSMHSIREICGAEDVEYMSQLIKGFYEDFTQTGTPF